VNWNTHQELRRNASHVVLIIGHLSDVKGYPTFLHAAARIASQLPDCQFLALGGETTGPGRSNATSGSTRSGPERSRALLGFRSDVVDVMRAADIIVLPSLSEGLPLVILEAMSCAKAGCRDTRRRHILKRSSTRNRTPRAAGIESRRAGERRVAVVLNTIAPSRGAMAINGRRPGGNAAFVRWAAW